MSVGSKKASIESSFLVSSRRPGVGSIMIRS